MVNTQASKASIRLERKHPLAIRWMHWINFPLIFLMIWSGLLIYWNDSDNAYHHPHAVYRIGIGGLTLVRLFPEWFWKAIHAPFHVTQGLGLHFFFMWFFALNGIVYVLFLALSGEWRFLMPEKRSLRDAVQVTLTDLHLGEGLPPQTKYNGAQRFAYTGVILMGLGMLVTGLAIYKPTQAHWLTTVLGGYEMARWEHFWLAMGFIAFFLVHVTQVALAGWNNFRSMVSGREIRPADEPSLEAEKEILVMQEPEDGNREEPGGGDHPAGDPGICSGETAQRETRAAGEQGASQSQPTGENEAAASSEQLPESSGESAAAEPGTAEPGTAEPGIAEPGALEAGAAERMEGSPAAETARVENLDAQVLAASRRYTRRSFAVAAVAVAAGYGLYHWAENSPAEEMQPWPLRRAFRWNAAISRRVFEERALAPTYPLSRARELRVNGVYGLKMALDPESYRLQVVGVQDASRRLQYTSDVTAWQYRYLDEKTMEDRGHDTKTPPKSAHTAGKMAPEAMMKQAEQRENRMGRMPRGREQAGESRSTLPVGAGGLLLTMADILRLPRRELVTQFKCIEGWSQIVHWAGVRMADFLEEYPPETTGGAEPGFVYMETPDGDYYTGYDMDICRHPQTLLVTEMMGAPLTQYHGAPLRLHMPTKYGYKQIKRIGLISYNRSRPDDYWTKLGYDWYAGL